jgi:hypothetical protein
MLSSLIWCDVLAYHSLSLAERDLVEPKTDRAKNQTDRFFDKIKVTLVDQCRENRFRMGNLQKHAGPLSANWHESQLLLARQIIQRMADLGIIPVLPAFTGFMPRAAPAYAYDSFLRFSNDSCALDVSLRPNSIIHPIGLDLVAMNLGQ